MAVPLMIVGVLGVVVVVYWLVKRRGDQKAVPDPLSTQTGPSPSIARPSTLLSTIIPAVGALFTDPNASHLARDVARLNTERNAIQDDIDHARSEAAKEIRDNALLKKIETTLKSQSSSAQQGLMAIRQMQEPAKSVPVMMTFAVAHNPPESPCPSIHGSRQASEEITTWLNDCNDRTSTSSSKRNSPPSSPVPKDPPPPVLHNKKIDSPADEEEPRPSEDGAEDGEENVSISFIARRRTKNTSTNASASVRSVENVDSRHSS